MKKGSKKKIAGVDFCFLTTFLGWNGLLRATLFWPPNVVNFHFILSICETSLNTMTCSNVKTSHIDAPNTQTMKWMPTKGFLSMGSICLEVQLLAVIIHQCATIWHVLEIGHAWDPRTLQDQSMSDPQAHRHTGTNPPIDQWCDWHPRIASMCHDLICSRNSPRLRS